MFIHVKYIPAMSLNVLLIWSNRSYRWYFVEVSFVIWTAEFVELNQIIFLNATNTADTIDLSYTINIVKF